MVALYDGDAAVQAVTGRTSGNLRPRGAPAIDANLPVATYSVLLFPEAAGTAGHNAPATVTIEVWADMRSKTIADLETLMDRAEALFRGVPLATQGIDANRNPIGTRRDGGEEDFVRSIANDLVFDVTD